MPCRYSFVLFSVLALPISAHATVSITLNTNIPSAEFTVSGAGCAPGAYATPQTLQWTSGVSCAVAFVSPYSQQVGTQYVFTGWQDAITSNPRVIVAPAQSTTFTAAFQTQYQISVVISPPQGGTVSGGGWVDSGGTAALTATAAAGYQFVAWSGSLGSTNPVVVGANNSLTVTATFEPLTSTVTGNWSVTQIVTYADALGVNALNSYGEVVGETGFGGSPNESPFLWTPIATNSALGAVIGFGGNTTLPIAASINDYGQVLFSGGNCPSCFTFTSGAATLWTPTVPHGTVGTTTLITASGNGDVVNTLNNFGQVGTSVNGSPAIWTPTAANETTGVVTENAQWQGLVAMNSYGQAIMSSTVDWGGISPLLFTPTTSNGTLGTFTLIPGLAGAYQTTLVAINDFGKVLGYSCVGQSSSTCQNQGFTWTPITANGTSGATAAMTMPPGFASMTPTAINLGGSVIGMMAPTSGNAIPFLYAAGNYYDLATISSALLGWAPVGVNQADQIVFDSGGLPGNVYLVTPPLLISAPQVLPPGVVNYVYPTTTFSAAGGTGSYTWSATGFPSGLSINPSTGIVGGTPTTATGSPFFVQVSVACCGTLAASRAYLLTIGTVNYCDVMNEGTAVGVLDVHQIINEALGLASASNDLNGDGVVNIADAQIVIGAATGLGCLGN
jgi:Divergent InlB B-repeat domain/Putative Ig domain